jgi:broad-specificity NMP kinase
MAIYFVTGIAGTGKSSVTKELIKRGYEAHDTDEYSQWVRYDNGELDDGKSGIPYGTPEFYDTFGWKLEPKIVVDLKVNSGTKTLFLCGSPGNSRELTQMFDKVFTLEVDDETLKHRLATRTDNDYGKAEHELNDILGWKKTFSSDHEALGATVLDATKPVTEVVDAILSGLI